jgi:hypothetical protein
VTIVTFKLRPEKVYYFYRHSVQRLITLKNCSFKVKFLNFNIICFQLNHGDLDELSTTTTSPTQTSIRGSSSRTKARSSGRGSTVIMSQPAVASPSPVQDPHAKIFELNRKLAFVKSEHQDILKGLHSEIEELKRKNKGKKVS